MMKITNRLALLSILFIFLVFGRATVQAQSNDNLKITTTAVSFSKDSSVAKIAWIASKNENFSFAVDRSGPNEARHTFQTNDSNDIRTGSIFNTGVFADKNVKIRQTYTYYITGIADEGNDQVSGQVSITIPPVDVGATNPANTGQADCAKHSTGEKYASVCTDLGRFYNIGSYLGAIIDSYVTPLAVIAALVMITFAGFQYIYSGGSPEATKLSKELIIGAVLGLVLIFMAGFIIDKLTDSGELNININDTANSYIVRPPPLA